MHLRVGDVMEGWKFLNCDMRCMLYKLYLDKDTVNPDYWSRDEDTDNVLINAYQAGSQGYRVNFLWKASHYVQSLRYYED